MHCIPDYKIKEIVLTGTNTEIGFNNKERALSKVSKNSENPRPVFTLAATVNVFLGGLILIARPRPLGLPFLLGLVSDPSDTVTISPRCRK